MDGASSQMRRRVHSDSSGTREGVSLGDSNSPAYASHSSSPFEKRGQPAVDFNENCSFFCWEFRCESDRYRWDDEFTLLCLSVYKFWCGKESEVSQVSQEQVIYPLGWNVWAFSVVAGIYARCPAFLYVYWRKGKASYWHAQFAHLKHLCECNSLLCWLFTYYSQEHSYAYRFGLILEYRSIY